MKFLKKIPIILIVGPTAAGKSLVAEEIRAKNDGEIINADATQVYRGLSILSAAPRELAGTHLYCFREVSELYSFAAYRVDADQCIADVWRRGKLPIIVGGAGLYVDALIHRTTTPPVTSIKIREQVARLSPSQVLDELRSRDPEILEFLDLKNPRRVQRALEVALQTGVSMRSFGVEREPTPYEPLWIGVTAQRDVLHTRIAARIDEMLGGGAIKEVQELLREGHTHDEPGMKAIGVAEISALLDGSISCDEARDRMITRTRQYARRQQTWFRKNSVIVWYNSSDDLCRLVRDFLQINFKVS